MQLRSIVRFAVPLAVLVAVAAPAAAQEDSSASGAEPYGLGPLEVAPAPLEGNLGAPRSAVPETRFGVLLHWLMATESSAAGSSSLHALSLLLEAHLELLGMLELGVDVEALQYTAISTPLSDDSNSDFGFITPRLKFAFLRGDMYTLSCGVGVLLPTASNSVYDHVTPLGFDPGLYFALRLLQMISINVSLPVALYVSIPDSGSTSVNTYINPTFGVTVMPIDFIGGFLDLQFSIWADHDSHAKALNVMNLIFGARSNFLPWMMGEIGAIIPVAGDAADLWDFGLGIRLVATPDFL